ncbi:MAG: VOC family protein [Paracoccaceae bacterium]
MTLGLLETSLYASDLDAAERFYVRVLGLEIARREAGRHVFLRAAGSMLLIFDPGASESPPPDGAIPVPPHGARGPGHACFAVDAEGIEGWRRRLHAAGVGIEREVTWPHGPVSLYFRDPAGNSLEIAERALWGFAAP